MSVDRAVFKAWLGPFVVSLVAIVLLLLLGHLRKVAAAALGAGLRPADVLGIFGALIPTLLVFAIPIAHLCGLMVGLGRMAVDGETVALHAAGASTWRLARTPVLVGLALSLAGLPIAHLAQPAAWRQLQANLTSVAIRNVSVTLADPRRAHRLGAAFLTARASSAGGGLQDLVLVAPEQGIVVAERGDLRPSANRLALVLEGGEIHPFDDESAAGYGRVRFDRADVPLDLVHRLATKIRLVSADGRLSTAQMWAEAARRPIDDPRRRRLQKMATRRTALPLLALAFGWMGTAIALADPRRRWGWALGAVLGVYLMLRAGDAIVAAAPGAVGAVVWFPHATLVIAGGAGLWLAGRPR